MHDLFLQRIAELQQRREPFAIATVISVHGSASAKPGSKALISDGGKNLQGWVGGGCAESHVIEQALEAMAERRPRLVPVDLEDELLGVGMPCGGRMEVFVEPVLPPERWIISGATGQADQFAWFVQRAGFNLVRTVGTDKGVAPISREGECFIGFPADEAQRRLMELWASARVPFVGIIPPAFEEQPNRARLSRSSEATHALFLFARFLAERRGRSLAPLRETKGGWVRAMALPALSSNVRLLLLGNNRITEELASMADQLRWQVAVRGTSNSAYEYPANVRVEPALSTQPRDFDANTAVIVATQHKGDPLSVRSALTGSSGYVGLITSAHRSGLVLEGLQADGLDESALARLHSPAGLDIGASNPFEIAVSILAEIISLQKGEGAGEDLRMRDSGTVEIPMEMAPPAIGRGLNLVSNESVHRSKEDFPIFRVRPAPNTLAYLDNAATTQKPSRVLEAMTRFYELHNGGVHRGVHRLAEAATEEYERSRAAVAGFLGAESAGSLIFTRGCTESIHLVAEGWLAPRLKPGDQVLVTGMEHHSNLLPWRRVVARTGADLIIWPVTRDGRLDLSEWDRLVGPRTRLLAFTAVSNVLGTINPVADLIRLARAAGVPVLVDAAQAVGHQSMDVGLLGCDFLACSAHKMYGPTGIGALYARHDRIEEMEPWQVGGGTVREVGPDGVQWIEGPGRFEAGTPPVAAAVGFAAATTYLRDLGMESVRAHESALIRQAIGLLGGCPGVQLHGPHALERIAGILSFNLAGVHPHDVAQVLDEDGIAVRAGSHCAQPLIRDLGVSGTVRLSVGVYNDAAEIERLAASVRRAFELLKP